MPRRSTECSQESINLLVTFLSAGAREVREASRISFDGKGAMIIYDGHRRKQSIRLSEISKLRIVPVRHAEQTPAKLRHPAGTAGAGMRNAAKPSGYEPALPKQRGMAGERPVVLR